MGERVKIGDIFSVVTSKGTAFAQVTHRHKQYGFFVRVYPISDATVSIDEVMTQKPIFSTFFPLQAAINQKLFTILTNKDVPEALKSFPIFKCKMPNLGIKKKNVSWIWDGENSIKRDHGFSELEENYPVREIISAPLLVDRIQDHYT